MGGEEVWSGEESALGLSGTERGVMIVDAVLYCVLGGCEKGWPDE